MRGVNIGGWLVLEKWMTPELYQGFDAEDEYHLLLSRKDKNKMLQKHRDTFITKEDFRWIKAHGIDTVRLPVGHWLFTANEPYVSAKKYVDLAFAWAREYDLNIVLDVHAAKGCQNGFDNGGLSGVISWHTDQQNIIDTLDFIKRLAMTYKDQTALAGIQLLNEPHWTISLDILQNFYKQGYNIIRDLLGDDIYVIMHDGFRVDAWQEFFSKEPFNNVYLDTHMYQVFGEIHKDASMNELSQFIIEKRYDIIKNLQKYVPVIVGEWSCALPKKTDDFLEDPLKREAAYHWLSNQLLLTYDEADGWFFWNYKLSKESTIKHSGWSFRDFVEKGYLPFREE